MSNGTGLTRGDRRRNRDRDRLRELLPRASAILAIDLGQDIQVAAVCDHDTRVLARRRVKVRADELGELLDWAVEQAAATGFGSVTVVCEPTGHRWRIVGELARRRGLQFVCVQPLLVHLEREKEDYTRDKTDYKDTLLIARLAARLDVYVPEEPDEAYARLRHLGARRNELIASATVGMQQLRDLLGCAWPAVLDAAACPFESTTWLAGLAVVLDRCHGNPAKLRQMGKQRFFAAIRRELPRWGGQRLWSRIAEAIWAALVDQRGVVSQRRGALERCHLILDAWRADRVRLADVEARMVAVLDQSGLTALVSTIPGLSPTAAAAILAETGDMSRFGSARAVVKHAGLNPGEHTSANFRGRTRITKRGRPDLRTTAWRAAWALIRHNDVAAARYTHLTSRDTNRLTPGQAHVAVAAALLRWLHAIITQRVAWNPLTAAGDITTDETVAIAA